MPDSLIISEIPAHPAASRAVPALSPVPFDATDLLVRLYREARAAEAALDESKGEADDGPLHEGYHSAFDQFMDAPVNTVGDVLLKLEAIAEHEDIEAKPNLIINRILLNLLRDLRATDTAYRHLSAIEAARRPASVAQAPCTVPVAESTSCRIETLRRERDTAEQRLEGSHEEDDGPLSKAFFAAHDRLIAEPVRTNADVIQKLEFLAEHELLDDPQTTPALVVANLIRDFREAHHLAPSLDLVAIHREADEQVDEIYGLLKRMDGGLLALREIGESVCAGPDEWNKLRFVIDGVSDIADDLLTANDAITNAIDPLNPTVLDE